MIKFMIFLLLSAASILSASVDDLLVKANQNYRKGLEAKTVHERQEAFSKSLIEYKEIEKSEVLSSKLAEAIGDTYFQLDDYPRAIAYYYISLRKEPSKSAYNHLLMAKEKLKLPKGYETYYIEKILTFNERLTLQKIYFLFFIFFVSYLLIYVFSHFVTNSALGFVKKVLFIFSAILLINLLVFNFFIPVSGVIVDPSYLYSDTVDKYASASVSTIPLGSKVRVLGVQKGGKWVKIETEEAIGYIPYSSIIIL